MNDPLPDMPRELIHLAIDDLEKTEGDGRYTIGMHSWHTPVKDNCRVCLAGAVMAQTLNADPGHLHYPCDYQNEHDTTISYRLEALDEFRRGDISLALDYMNLVPSVFDRRVIPEYEKDPAAFKAAMRQLADDLGKIKFKKRSDLYQDDPEED